MSQVSLFVLDVEEFRPVVDAARALPAARVSGPRHGYYRIDATDELVLQRKPMGFKPALWWSMLTGGYLGQIASYTRDELRMVGDGVQP